MKLTREQLGLLMDKMKRQLDVDPQTGTVKWKDPLVNPKGAWAKTGQEVKVVVIRTPDYKTKRVPAKYLVFLEARGYVPQRLTYKDPTLKENINAISNLLEQTR